MSELGRLSTQIREKKISNKMSKAELKIKINFSSFNEIIEFSEEIKKLKKISPYSKIVIEAEQRA